MSDLDITENSRANEGRSADRGDREEGQRVWEAEKPGDGTQSRNLASSLLGWAWAYTCGEFSIPIFCQKKGTCL